MVKYYQECPEIEQDYEQMKSGDLKLAKFSTTRYSEIVFYLLNVVLHYSLYHLFSDTQAGSHFADKTHQVIVIEQQFPLLAHEAYTTYFGGVSERQSTAHAWLLKPCANGSSDDTG